MRTCKDLLQDKKCVFSILLLSVDMSSHKIALVPCEEMPQILNEILLLIYLESVAVTFTLTGFIFFYYLNKIIFHFSPRK